MIKNHPPDNVLCVFRMINDVFFLGYISSSTPNRVTVYNTNREQHVEFNLISSCQYVDSNNGGFIWINKIQK